MTQVRVLIVNNDRILLRALSEILRLRMADVRVDTAESGADAIPRLLAEEYKAIVADVKMPGSNGLSLLAEIQLLRPKTPIIIVTGPGEHELAIQALREGSFDFLQKPIDYDHLIASLRRSIHTSESRGGDIRQAIALQRHANELKRTLDGRKRELEETTRAIESPHKWLMGPGRKMQKVFQEITLVANSPLTILIEGESGTGKELVARAIHQLSSRCKKPFVDVDCGAIPDTLIESELFGYEKGAFTGADQRKEGRFQLADGGSLFLDEIANLSLSTQVKFLRVLQERHAHPLGGKQPFQVNARIIAASNVLLQQEVQKGHFRLDLLHRLNEFSIALPALRERDDILDLANYFLAEASLEFGCPARELSEAAAEVLLRYSWPGNVRELRNTIRRAAVCACDVIEPGHLSHLTTHVSPTTVHDSQSFLVDRPLKEIAETAAADAERQAIRQALLAAEGNRSKAARCLRTDYKTLYLKMKQYGIPLEEFKKSCGPG